MVGGAASQMVLDLLIENAGRVNYGNLEDTRKGCALQLVTLSRDMLLWVQEYWGGCRWMVRSTQCGRFTH